MSLPPLSRWTDLDSLQTSDEPVVFVDRVRGILDLADFEHLATEALNERRRWDGQDLPGMECLIDTSTFTYGKNNLVLKAKFSDGHDFIAKIWHGGMAQQPAVPDPDVDQMRVEMTTLQMLRKKTAIPVPQVYSWDITADNKFRYPYMLMECLGGRRRLLDRPVLTGEPEAKIGGQVARTLLELEKLEFDRMGMVYPVDDKWVDFRVIPRLDWHHLPEGVQRSSLSCLDYFRRLGDGGYSQAALEDPEMHTAYHILRSALTHIVVEDRSNGPFHLCHQDLGPNHLRFDEEYNLVGITGWDDAEVVPLEIMAKLIQKHSGPRPRAVIGPRPRRRRGGLGGRVWNEVRIQLALLERQYIGSLVHRTMLSDLFGTPRIEMLGLFIRSRRGNRHTLVQDGKSMAKLIYKRHLMTWRRLVWIFGWMEL
jgi:hypothetical protein